MTHKLVVHCKRSKFDVYIGRPSIWGNPFVIGQQAGTRQDAVQMYSEWLDTQPDLIARAKRELKGKVLGCFCAPLACHGEVLAKLANPE